MTPSSSGSERLLTRAFVLLALADLAYFTSVGVAIHTLPLYATGPIGSGEAGAGLAFGVFGVSALLCRPMAGRLADRRGRLPLMLVGAGLAAGGMLLLPVADSLLAVVGIRLLQGVGEAAFYVASFALLADIAPPDRMGEALSYNSLGLYLGIALGPPLGEVVQAAQGFTATWISAAVLAGAAIVLTVVIDVPPSTDVGGDGHLIHWPAIPISLGFFASLAAMGGFLAFATLYAEDIGMADTSLPLLLYGSVVVVCRVVFATVPDRLPPLPLGSASLVVMGLGLLVVATWDARAGLLLGAAVLGVGITFSTPAFFSAIFATAAPNQRGAAAGTATAFMDLGLGFGPIALGVVAGAQGVAWAFGTAAVIAFMGAAWTTRLSLR
jgi:MFS family permease